jgi:secreted trypsin-like serine protease
VRIVGGTESPDGCRTYQVALLNNLRQFCGGTLIDDDWVLTAAHCLDRGTNVADISVAVGGQNLTAFDGEIIPAANIFVHPLWGSASLSFDVALIRLANDADPSYTRARLSNPTVDSAIGSPGQYLLSTGWGVTQSFGNTASAELLEVSMPVKDNAECNNIGITEREICSTDFAKSTCFGDSGGPFAGLYNGEVHVLGIVSYGDAGCSFYSVYARVSSYEQWVNDTMAQFP